MEVLKRIISQPTEQCIHYDIVTYVHHCTFSMFAFLSLMISTPVNNILSVAASAVCRTLPFFLFLSFMFIFITRKERHVKKKESYSLINWLIRLLIAPEALLDKGLTLWLKIGHHHSLSLWSDFHSPPLRAHLTGSELWNMYIHRYICTFLPVCLSSVNHLSIYLSSIYQPISFCVSGELVIVCHLLMNVCSQ